MPEANQVNWIGIRPTNPEENIPVKQSDETLLNATVTQASNVREVYPKRKTGTTQIAKYQTANNGTEIVHTVTTGKTLFLCTIVLSALPVATGGITIEVTNASDVWQYYIVSSMFLINEGAVSPIPFNPPLEIPAGYKIKITSDTVNFYARIFVYGWEE